MRINKFRTRYMTTKKIHQHIMESKSILDTIAEEKDLDDSHDLCLASNYLDKFLDVLEEQYPELIE